MLWEHPAPVPRARHGLLEGVRCGDSGRWTGDRPEEEGQLGSSLGPEPLPPPSACFPAFPWPGTTSLLNPQGCSSRSWRVCRWREAPRLVREGRGSAAWPLALSHKPIPSRWPSGLRESPCFLQGTRAPAKLASGCLLGPGGEARVGPPITGGGQLCTSLRPVELWEQNAIPRVSPLAGTLLPTCTPAAPGMEAF